MDVTLVLRHAWVMLWCAKCGVHQDHPDANKPCKGVRNG